MTAPFSDDGVPTLSNIARSGRGDFKQLPDVSAADLEKAIRKYVETLLATNTPGVIEISHARVAGELQLANILSARGSSIGCKWNECEFTSPLVLDGAILSFLHLCRCCIHVLRANNIHVLNDIEIRSTWQSRNNGESRLDFRGVCVEGSMRFLESNKFHIDSTAKADSTRKRELNAVDLGGARIAGDIVFEDRTATPASSDDENFFGGVSLQGATVSGNVVFHGQRVGANQLGRYSIDLSGAKIGLSLSLEDCILGGTLQLRESTIGTHLRLAAVSIKPTLRRSSTEYPSDALNLDVASIGGYCSMYGGCKFLGPLNMKSARIGEFLELLDLYLTVGEDAELRALDATGIKVGSTINLGVAQGPKSLVIRGVSSFDRALTGGDFNIWQLEIECTAPNVSENKYPVLFSVYGAQITGRLQATQLINQCPMAIDLSLVRAGAVAGRLESGWGEPHEVQLKLEGMRYDAFVATGSEPAGDSLDEKDAIKWLMRQWPRGLIDRHAISLQPFQQLAKAYEMQGNVRSARWVLKEGLGLELRSRFIRDCFALNDSLSWGRTNVFKFSEAAFRLVGCLFLWAFQILFGYGYLPQRASATLLGFWLLGAALVHQGDEEHLFVPTATPVDAPIVQPSQIAAGKPIGPMPSSDRSGSLPCADLNSFVYAFDVMVPLLDLHEESRCSVNPSEHFWSFIKSLYAVIGWILTSVGILTLSGVLRRDLR